MSLSSPTVAIKLSSGCRLYDAQLVDGLGYQEQDIEVSEVRTFVARECGDRERETKAKKQSSLGKR